ncbi:hypothetical protein [Kineosporia sp. R_H_3]|uniref:hypothetical protein n=1 Tax=Kineosporia sp. R_H_3 TaxID=1961848 RepID=UPI000B4BB5C2|nr:hypothetical protein [Kineosporia sp. R_H_3]
MKDDHQPPDPLVVAALRRLGDEHEPDSDAIWARVDPARAGAETPVALDGRRDRAVRTRPVPGGPRRPRLTGTFAAALAAASVLGVLVVSQVVTRPQDGATPATVTSRTPSDGPTSATTGSDGAPPTALGSAAATSPQASSGSSSADRSPTRGGAGPTTSRPDGTGTPSRPGGGPARPGFPAPSLAPVGSGERAVLLSTDVLADWVAVGARGDGRQVRAKRPASGGVFDVVAPAGAIVTPSPLLVSWSDGFPEQSRTGATTWLQGPRGGRWTITIDRVDVPRRLVVRAGGAPAGVRVDVTAPGRQPGRWVLGDNPAGPGPFTVALEVPGGAGPVTVTLTPADQDGLAVSAVTLQRI